MRFRLIEDQRDVWPVRVMCDALSVSPSGFYAWRSRPERARKIANRELLVDIRRQGPVGADAALGEPGRGAAASRRNDRRRDADCVGRILSSIIGADRQSQSRHRHGQKDRRAVLQRGASRHGLLGSRRLVL